MNKITPDHLARRAYVYIRQSTPGQVKHNLESQRMQYAVAERARALGWQDVDIVDEDLGVSASGTNRAGFERLPAVCDGKAGAVFSIEAAARDCGTQCALAGLTQLQYNPRRVGISRHIEMENLAPFVIDHKEAVLRMSAWTR